MCAHLLNIIALILCDTWHFLLPRDKVVIVIVIVVTVVVAALVLAVVSGTYKWSVTCFIIVSLVIVIVVVAVTLVAVLLFVAAWLLQLQRLLI